MKKMIDKNTIGMLKPREYPFKVTSVEDALRDLEAYQPPELPNDGGRDDSQQDASHDISLPDIKPVEGFMIESLSDRYRIHNVEHRGELYVVDWSKELLDDGRSHLQDDWLNLTKNSEFKLASAPLYNSNMFSLFNNQNTGDAQQKALLEEMVAMFKKDFKDRYMMTSSRVAYQPKGNDKVIHDLGCKDKYDLNAEIIGPDGFVNAKCGFGSSIDALLGTKDLAQIGKAYEWIGGKKPYLYRINSKPDNEVLRAVVLGIYINSFYTYDVIVNFRPARGAVARRAKKSP